MSLNDNHSCIFPLNEGKFNLGNQIVSVTFVSILVGIEVCTFEFNSAIFIFTVTHNFFIFSWIDCCSATIFSKSFSSQLSKIVSKMSLHSLLKSEHYFPKFLIEIYLMCHLLLNHSLQNYHRILGNSPTNELRETKE